MAEPWFTKYNESFVATPGQFDWGGYGVVVEMVEGAGLELVGGHHLDQSENRGEHHIYGDILDAEGNRLPGVTVAHRRDGDNTIHMVAADKPDNEPAFNIPVWPGEIVEVWIANAPGAGPLSDRVKRVRTDLPDEPPGNTRYHHSVYAVWQVRRTAAPVTLPADPPSGSPDVAEALLALQDALNDIGVARHLLGAE